MRCAGSGEKEFDNGIAHAVAKKFTPRIAAIKPRTATTTHRNRLTASIMACSPSGWSAKDRTAMRPKIVPPGSAAAGTTMRQRNKVRPEERQLPDQRAIIAQQHPAGDEGDRGARVSADRQKSAGHRIDRERSAGQHAFDGTGGAGNEKAQNASSIPAPTRRATISRGSSKVTKPPIRQPANIFGIILPNSRTSLRKMAKNRSDPSRK